MHECLDLRNLQDAMWGSLWLGLTQDLLSWSLSPVRLCKWCGLLCQVELDLSASLDDPIFTHGIISNIHITLSVDVLALTLELGLTPELIALMMPLSLIDVISTQSWICNDEHYFVIVAIWGQVTHTSGMSSVHSRSVMMCFSSLVGAQCSWK